MREERLKDDLDLSRRQKLELEAALLDRDARAIESKFDLGMLVCLFPLRLYVMISSCWDFRIEASHKSPLNEA